MNNERSSDIYADFSEFYDVYAGDKRDDIPFYLEYARSAQTPVLEIGAGTGLLFLLRWFWWRINAFSEIAAMGISFMIAVYFEFIHVRLGLPEIIEWQRLVIGVGSRPSVGSASRS